MRTSIKQTLTILALIILTVPIIITTNIPNANAQSADKQFAGALPSNITPNSTVETRAYLSYRPNPIGAGQTLLINIWLPPIHVARNFTKAYVVTITDPDGKEETFGPMDSYNGDATAWFEYTPNKVGNWTIKFDFLGTYFPRTVTPSGGVFAPSITLESVYYKPSSTGELPLTVQEAPVEGWPETGLPTDYWTRPVSGEKREWSSILGSYPPDGIVGVNDTKWPANTNPYMSNYGFVPYVQGPTSAHIVWKKDFMLGGLVGGPGGAVTNVAGGLTGGGYPTIIYAGRCYESYSKPGTGSTAQTYWRCYDLRTGQTYWDQPVSTTTTLMWGVFPMTSALVPTFIEYGKQGAEVAGATAREGITVTLDALIGTNLLKWDPYTGAIVTNITGPPSDISSNTLGDYPYMYGIQTVGFGADTKYNLIKWNIENNAGNWVTGGGGGQTTEQNFTKRIVSNVTWPFNSLGTVDYQEGVAVVTQAINSPGTGVAAAERIMAADLETGALLWNKTTDAASGLEIFFAQPAIADHGKYAARMLSGEWWAWNLRTGNIDWKAQATWPWGQFGAYDTQSAYGLLYSDDYDGIRAINWTNGNIEWTFQAPTQYPYETYYEGQYSFHSAGVVADGKLYTFNTEHTPSQPITRGWRLFCINATSGEGIWNITCSQGLPGSRYLQGAIADGYFIHTNEYDGYTYCYGKGESQTTVQAPLTAITEGQSVVLTGTVTDLSPAQPGTPCVSKESMTAWMEYIHQQKPMPNNVIGVSVSLDTVDPNNNFVHIGTAVSDGSGVYSLMWQPEVPGKYKIIATFAGDESYGSSFAETAVGVVSAAEPTAGPTVQPATVSEQYFIPAIAGIIVLIVVVAILQTVLLLRKRP